MGRNNEDFGSQVRVHRGLGWADFSSVETDHLGLHWTSDAQIAENFANHLTYNPEEGEGLLSHGLLLSGTVDRRHVVTPDDPAFKKMAGELGINGPDSVEKETTLLPRIPITNLSATLFIKGKAVETRQLGEGNTGTSYRVDK